MTYKEYIMSYTRSVIKECGGTREVGRQYGIDASIISKWSTGVQIPSIKTFKKYFVDAELPDNECDLFVNTTDSKITVVSGDLEVLKEKLSLLGYRIEIVKE